MFILKNWWRASQRRRSLRRIHTRQLIAELSRLEYRVRMLERARNREAAGLLQNLPVLPVGYMPEPRFQPERAQ